MPGRGARRAHWRGHTCACGQRWWARWRARRATAGQAERGRGEASPTTNQEIVRWRCGANAPVSGKFLKKPHLVEVRGAGAVGRAGRALPGCHPQAPRATGKGGSHGGFGRPPAAAHAALERRAARPNPPWWAVWWAKGVPSAARASPAARRSHPCSLTPVLHPQTGPQLSQKGHSRICSGRTANDRSNVNPER